MKELMVLGFLLLAVGLVSGVGYDGNSDGAVDARDVDYCLEHSCMVSANEIANKIVSDYEVAGLLEVGTWCTCETADLDGDGSVGLTDLAMLGQYWGTAAGDMNGDGTTNENEQECVAKYYDQSCGIIPPVIPSWLWIPIIILVGAFVYLKFK